MAVAFLRGQKLTKDDLCVYVYTQTLSGMVLTDPYQINFNIYDCTLGTPALIMPAYRPVAQVTTGVYYAPWVTPYNGNLGEYKVEFNWQLEQNGGWTQQSYRFQVVAQMSILNNESLKTVLDSASSGTLIGGYQRLYLSGDIVYVVLGEDYPDGQWYF
jgi:hypothetical protein